MTVADITTAVRKALKGTRVGSELEAEARKAEEQRETRAELRAKFDQADAERGRLPELEEAVAKAKASRDAALEKHNAAVAKASREFQQAASLSGLYRGRAEAALRRSAPPMVNDNGPVVRAIGLAIEHLLPHSLGTDLATYEAIAGEKPDASDAARVDRVAGAKRKVTLARSALERIAVLETALDDLRELQLDVEPDEAVVREVLDALPTTCACGEGLVRSASTAFLAPGKGLISSPSTPAGRYWPDVLSITNAEGYTP